MPLPSGAPNDPTAAVPLDPPGSRRSLAPMLYAVFYPQPYLGQLVRNIPIVVVDQDNTDLSRSLIQALSAHGNLSIALRATTFAEAEDAIQARRAFGIVGIPPDTERNVLKGVS